MPFSKIQRLPGEPVFIVCFEGEMTAADMEQASDTLFSWWTEDLKPTGSHLIMDILNVTKISFTESMKSFKVTLDIEAKYADIMPYVHYYSVGTNALAKLWVNWRRLQSGGREVPMFAKLDDAIEAARTNVRHTTGLP